jgi:hypothetical protein
MIGRLFFNRRNAPVTETTQPTDERPTAAAFIEGFARLAPKYRSHKTVHAAKIEGVTFAGDSKIAFVLEGIPNQIVVEKFERFRLAEIGDIFVMYEDGYCSISPANVFESGYQRIGDERDYPPGYFRKKPVVIEAFLLRANGPTPTPEWFNAALADGTIARCYPPSPSTVIFEIKTLEGTMAACIGDWIIKGVKGEIYPCKPDIFAATYDAA